MEYKSNANDVILNIKQKLLSNESQQALLKTIAQTLYVSNLRRIHNEGTNVSGTRIGAYSAKALYINPKYSPQKFDGAGKEGRKTFISTGKPHKTRYFKSGYKQYRSAVGRESGFVNLQLSGSLKANWQMVKTPSGYSIGFISAKKALIAEGMEDHFNCKIWGVTNNDRTIINEIVKNWAHRKK